MNQSLIFNCDCWLRYSTPKRILYSTELEDIVDNYDIVESLRYIMLLTVFSVLILVVIFSWIFNMVCYRCVRSDSLSKEKGEF